MWLLGPTLAVMGTGVEMQEDHIWAAGGSVVDGVDLAGPWGLDGYSEISGESIIRASDGSIVARVCCGQNQAQKAAAIAALPLLLDVVRQVAEGRAGVIVRVLAQNAIHSIEEVR